MLKEAIAEAVRIEVEEKTGRVFVVFEITNEKMKQEIKRTWTDNLEFKLIDRCLIPLE